MSPFAEASARGFAAQPSQPPLVEEELMTQVTGTFFGFSEMGLLDFSAPVSWIGVDGNGWKYTDLFRSRIGIAYFACVSFGRMQIDIWCDGHDLVVNQGWDYLPISQEPSKLVWSYDTENDDLIEFQIGYL